MSRRAQPYRESLGTRPPGQALDNMMRGTAAGEVRPRSVGSERKAVIPGGRKPRSPRSARKPRNIRM